MVVEFEALFLAEALGLWAALNRSWLGERLPPGLRLAGAKVLRSTALGKTLGGGAMLGPKRPRGQWRGQLWGALGRK